MAVAERYIPRLRKKYEEEVAPKLMERFGYKSPMQIPRIKRLLLIWV